MWLRKHHKMYTFDRQVTITQPGLHLKHTALYQLTTNHGRFDTGRPCFNHAVSHFAGWSHLAVLHSQRLCLLAVADTRLRREQNKLHRMRRVVLVFSGPFSPVRRHGRQSVTLSFNIRLWSVQSKYCMGVPASSFFDKCSRNSASSKTLELYFCMFAVGIPLE